MFSKTLESSFAIMAHLAEVYDGQSTVLTAVQIADDRKLPRPMVAKLLSTLVQAGLVLSKPGRNGGFALARPPAQITLLAVAEAVGYRRQVQCCVFGPTYTDAPGQHCPLHTRVCHLRDEVTRFLSMSTLDGFRRA